jgi:IclR family acetate operon transcriptional repressor
VSSLSYLLGTLVERGYLARDGRRYSAGPGCSGCRRAAAVQPRRARRAAGAHAARPAQRDHELLHPPRLGGRGAGDRIERAGAALRGADRQPAADARARLGQGAARGAQRRRDSTHYSPRADRTRYTASTVVSEKALRKEIAQIRKDGFSFTDEEFSLGIVGIGRAVTIAGEAVGALSVAIPRRASTRR